MKSHKRNSSICLLVVIAMLVGLAPGSTRAQDRPGLGIEPSPFDPGGGLFINCGATGEVVDEIGRLWQPDAQFLRPEHPGTETDVLEGARVDTSLLYDEDLPEEVLASERRRDGDLHYQIPVPIGDYRVVLYFAENCAECVSRALGGGGCRDCKTVFDVEVEGLRVNDYDVADEAYSSPRDGQGAVGVATALIFQPSVGDEVLDVRVIDKGTEDSVGDASIKAIAVEALEPEVSQREEPVLLEWPSLRDARVVLSLEEFETVVREVNELTTSLLEERLQAERQGEFEGESREVDSREESPGPLIVRDWLHAQVIEGPEILTTLGAFLEEALARVDREEPEDRGRLISSLYLELASLPVGADDLPPPGMEDEEIPQRLILGETIQLTPATVLNEELVSSLEDSLDSALYENEDPSNLQYPAASVEIPLERRQYIEQKSPSALPELDEVDHTIDAGDVPPNFVHTWAIDTKGISSFKLNFKSAHDIVLRWKKPGEPAGSGDRIKVVNACNQVLATFESLYEVQTKSVTLAACKWDAGKTYNRVFLVLETGSAPFKGRRFSLGSLRNTSANSGGEKALVIDDRINYDTKEVFTVARDENGKAYPLYPPWGNNKNGSWVHKNPMARDKNGFLVEEGWHLVGESLTQEAAKKKYYTLVYYNDISSQLRLYLLNKSLPTMATFYEVELSLQGRIVQKQSASGTEAKYADLQGAFFPVHADPKEWSRAQVAVPKWETNEWTMVEVPFLYPMSSSVGNLLEKNSVAYSSVHGQPVKWYHSIYEEAFKTNLRNLRLCVKVKSATSGALNATSIGKAVGKAVQTYQQGASASFLDYLEDINDGIKKGEEWYDSAEKVFEKAKKFLELEKGLGDEIKYIIEGGASVFSGIAGVAGFALHLFSDLLSSDPEPLQLAMELATEGVIKGKLVTMGTEQTTWFYLPGRASLEDAFRDVQSGGESLAASDLDFVDSRLPRFSRTMGLFGYQYNPENIVVQVKRERKVWKGVLEIVFPKSKSKSVSNLLPVIYNPYAEISPVSSVPHIAAFDTTAILWEHCTQIVGTFCPRQPEVSVGVVTYDDVMQYRKFADRKDLDTFGVDYGYHLKNGTDDWNPKEMKGIAPLHDVMYYWDVPYRYHGPSRFSVLVLDQSLTATQTGIIVWKLADKTGTQGVDPDAGASNPTEKWEYMTMGSPVRVQLTGDVGHGQIVESALLRKK